jgi:hypothetical protein
MLIIINNILNGFTRDIILNCSSLQGGAPIKASSGANKVLSNNNPCGITKHYNCREDDNELGHYLAGYIEGDGSLITPTELKNRSNRDNVCSVQIIFHICDLEFVKLLQKRIGHGNIYFAKNTQTVRLMIQNLEGVLLIVNLINGKMRTPKIYKLHKMID